ncbi:sensor histidine kinase [Amycolatopsis samaneae]|uniref:histidine kinase n=1 Tax=Amycolatopsis samaneae TaxID=664691 RepID=A0ABW5GI46_9PSEU
MKSFFAALARAQSTGNTMLWAAFVVFALAERLLRGAHGAAWWVVGMNLVLLVVAGALIRIRPLVSWLIAGALTVGQLDGAALSPSFQLTYPLVLATVSYLVGRSVREARWPLAAFAVVVSGSLFAVIGVGYLSGDPLPRVARDLVSTAYLLLALTLLGVLPWLVGRYRRVNAELATAGWERARQLEREQEITAEQERLRERARIAQDMHDSLGHALSLLVLRAGAFEIDPAADERLRGFAADTRRSVTGATEELSTIIGVLREEPAPAGPVHESIAELVDRTAASGADVTLEHTGEPVALRPIADRAAYRVVQESLTNATKHAPGAPVRVRLGYGSGETVVDVVNAPPVAKRMPVPQGKRGLIGLEERVRVAGGVLTAGPYEGGFRVTATLPHAEPVVLPGNHPHTEGARRGFEAEQRRTKLRLTRGLVVAFGLSAGVVVLVAGLFALWVFNSVLSRADYDRLAVGAPRTTVESVLPALDLRSFEVAEPPRPAGASCEYYLTSVAVVPVPRSVYRLCFDGSRLVGKDVIAVPG